MTNVSSPTGSHLSYSALKDLLSCGKQFQLARILKLPQRPGYALAGGRAVHSAIEAYNRWAMTR